MNVSPVRSTNPLGRPFGGGRGSRGGSGNGRWIRGGKRFNRHDRSASRSPKRYQSRNSPDFHHGRNRPYDAKPSGSRSNIDTNSIDKEAGKEVIQKTTEPQKSDSILKIAPHPQFKDVPQNTPQNNDPPPPGTELEDDMESVEKMLAHANKIRKEVMIKSNPDLVKFHQ